VTRALRASALALALTAACAKKHESKLTAADIDGALTATAQCVEATTSLAPSYQLVGPKLAAALKMDRSEAQRLMRDSIDLLISTREMLCNVSQGVVDHALEQDPHDERIAAASLRVRDARDHLQKVRTAYDALLGAASASDVPVDQDALLDRMQHALTGQ